MKIAVTYEDGNVFQHFGRTEQFKVYEVEDGKVVSSEVLGSGDAGHEALAYLLADNQIQVLICGGLGDGAQRALGDAGIEVISGAEGNTDEAVQAYLRGELVSQGVNCDHHDHEHGEGHEGGCHGHDEEAGGCDPAACAGCPGCGGAPTYLFEGKNVGKVCVVHYRGTLDDGSQFDSSYDRGEPIQFVCGAGMMIRGFDLAVAEMEPGQKVSVHLEPEEAYGMPDPNAVFVVESAMLQGVDEVAIGEQIYLMSEGGQPFIAKLVARDENTVTFDANHEMAGKALNFDIELVEIR